MIKQSTAPVSRLPETLRNDSLALLSQAEAVTVRNDDEYQSAGEFLASVKTLISKIKSHHSPMKRKAMATVEEIRSKEKELLTPAEQAKNLITSAMETYLAERRAKQERLIAKAEARSLPAPVVIERPKPIGVKVFENWNFSIIDPSKIDPSFMVPDLRAIQKMVDSMHEKAVDIVGGIKVWREDDVR